MDKTKEFIRLALADQQRNFETVIKGLSQSEIIWQPKDTLNSIGLILFHTARTEDFFIQELVRQQPQVWEKDEWYKKCGFALEERGRHYKAEQVKAFVSPDISLLTGYAASVRKHSLDYLAGLTDGEYLRVVKTPRGERTVSSFLSSIIVHAAEHTGEISYLRGLQRGLNQ